MLSAATAPEPLTAAHRAKLAYVYVRQSSVRQVRQHQESTELQYRLVERAIGLGWPRERVHVIDEDLGRSGATSAERHGFQRLIAEIGLGNAGLVLSLDASRLARNNRDWHQLLELCSLFGVILADGERLYDPSAYHDRLLLGLSGIMSEAELHQIKLRLHQGERQKAARGELRLPLPAGLSRGRGGDIVLNPDEEVQERLRLVFVKFAELQSARAVMRYLRAHDLPLPVRPLLGPAPHEVAWREANSARVRSHPAEPRLCRRLRLRPTTAGSGAAAIRDALRHDQGRGGAWEVCLPAAFPGYVCWEEFMANQRRLADNVNRYAAGHARRPAPGSCPAAGDCRVRTLRASDEPALHRPERRLSGLLLPRRSRPGRGAAVPGGARVAGRRLCRAHPARGPGAGPDRDRRRGGRAAAGGSAPAREAVGLAARARPLRSRAGTAPVRRGRAGEPPGGAIPGAGLGGEAARRRGDRAGVRTVAPRRAARAGRGRPCRPASVGRGPAAGMAGGDDHRGRPQAPAALHHQGGGPRPEASPRPGLAQDPVADRCDQRASLSSDTFTPTATTSISSRCGSGWRPSTPPARWTRRSRRC